MFHFTVVVIMCQIGTGFVTCAIQKIVVQHSCDLTSLSCTPGHVPEFSIYNPEALFRKCLSNNIDFLNSAPGVVYAKLPYHVNSAYPLPDALVSCETDAE